MATFPALVPSSAPITPGTWPVTITTSLNGAEARIRHGSAPIGRRLQLVFANISEANFLAIVAHYRGQRSGFDSFGFDTTTLAADLTPAGHAWIYVGRPQVVDDHVDCFTVTCEFKAEPRGLVVAPGKAWRSSQTTMTRNVAPGVQWVSGASTFLPGTGARFASGKQWATDATTFTPQGSNMGRSFVTSLTTFTPGSRIVISDSTYTITGGTVMTWGAGVYAYGWTFTVSTNKVIKGVGFYDDGLNGLNGRYFISLYDGPVDSAGTNLIALDDAQNYFAMEVPPGTGASLSGSWRRVNLTTTGATLTPGITYTLYCEPESVSSVDNVIKGASALTIAPGVNYGQNYFLYPANPSVITTAADGIAYFGPMIFFE